jgi:putative membrane protein
VSDRPENGRLEDDSLTEETPTEIGIPSLPSMMAEMDTVRIRFDDLSLGGLPPPKGMLPRPVPASEVESTPTPATKVQWRSLHPASLLINLVPQAWRTMKMAWWWLLALFIGSEGMGIGATELMVVFFFAGISVWNTLIHWATLRYRVHGNRLEITSGLLNRQSRTIDPARIQNIELIQNLLHKWTGLVELRIETAGNASTEGLLSALSVEEADRLQQQLATAGSLLATGDRDDGQEQTLVKMSLSEIVAFGLSRRTIGSVAIMTAVGLEVLGQFGPEATRDVAAQITPTVVFAAFLLAFAGSWIASITASIFRHHGFRLVRRGQSLWTEEGLTTRRRVEIPLTKVQLVRADEPWLRRGMGFGTVMVETAGLGGTQGEVRQAEGVIPMVDCDALGDICRAAVPRADIDPWTAPLLPAHPRALYRGIMGTVARACMFAIPLFLLLDGMGWLALSLIPAAIPSAWLDWKKQGWLVTERAIVSRRGFFNRRTFVVARDKLQSVHLVEGPVMRMHGLARLVVRVAGSQIALPDIGKAEASALMARLAR